MHIQLGCSRFMLNCMIDVKNKYCVKKLLCANKHEMRLQVVCSVTTSAFSVSTNTFVHCFLCVVKVDVCYCAYMQLGKTS